MNYYMFLDNVLIEIDHHLVTIALFLEIKKSNVRSTIKLQKKIYITRSSKLPFKSKPMIL